MWAFITFESSLHTDHCALFCSLPYWQAEILITHTHTHTHTHLIEEREWRRQSQAVQRHLPRPVDVNTTILRGAPHKDQKYRALYEAEELIKQEMLVMMQHDLVHLPPPPSPNGGLQVTKATLNRTRQELEKNSKEDFTEDELQQVGGSLFDEHMLRACFAVDHYPLLLCAMHLPIIFKGSWIAGGRDGGCEEWNGPQRANTSRICWRLGGMLQRGSLYPQPK